MAYTGSLPPTSNRETWQLVITLTDPDTNTAPDLTGATATMGLRPDEQSLCLLTGSTSDGHLTIDADAGTLTILFSDTEMKSLSPGEYDIGVMLTVDGQTHQLIAATLPVIDGVIDP
jgi:hypothetical protein